jgi:hypothetical protein
MFDLFYDIGLYVKPRRYRPNRLPGRRYYEIPPTREIRAMLKIVVTQTIDEIWSKEHSQEGARPPQASKRRSVRPATGAGATIRRSTCRPNLHRESLVR